MMTALIWTVTILLVTGLIIAYIKWESTVFQPQRLLVENRLAYEQLIKAIEIKGQPDQVFHYLVMAMEHFMVVEKMVKNEGETLSEDDKKIARTIVKEYLIAFALQDVGDFIKFRKMIPKLVFGKWQWPTPPDYQREIDELHAANQAADINIH